VAKSDQSDHSNKPLTNKLSLDATPPSSQANKAVTTSVKVEDSSLFRLRHAHSIPKLHWDPWVNGFAAFFAFSIRFR
jgi:hypothetical protein